MIPLGFSHRAYAIHEVEPRFKIGKQKTLRDVMLFDDLPVRQLLGEWNQVDALQWRHATPARSMA